MAILGVDVGGTFSDAVLLDGVRLVTAKVPTARRQEESVLDAARAVGAVAVDDYFRTPVLVPAGGSGFDWGDAGIGAASGFGLALAVAGLGLLALRRRTDETKTGTAATVPS